jgi:hypothetical protein
MTVPIAPELLPPAGGKRATAPPARPAAEKRHEKHGPHQMQTAARSGVQRLRAAAVTTAAQVGLAAVEHAAVSGKAAKLRKAIRRLPPALARATVRGEESATVDDDGAAETAGSRPEAPASERSAQGAPHAREGGQAVSARLDLPLPDGGEARVAVEAGEGGAAAGTYRVDVELQLAQLGTVDVHLVSDESQLLCRVECADPDAREQLEGALAALRDELAAATGKSVGVALERARPDAPRLEPLGGLDAYA